MPTFRTPPAGRPAAIVLVAVLAVVAGACASSAGSSILSTVGRTDLRYLVVHRRGAAPVRSGARRAQRGTGRGARRWAGRRRCRSAPWTTRASSVPAPMQLDVRDVPQAVATARTLIRGMGGYVGASNTANDGDQPIAQITYRIPVERWEDALAALRDLNGQTTKVVVEQTEAVEVTGQIVDLEARIRNLRASESALQGIAAKAVKISDVLEVQQQLTDVRGQIEVLTAELVDLANRADLATLTVTFGVPVVAVEVAQQGWDPTTVVDEASASLVGVLQGLATRRDLVRHRLAADPADRRDPRRDRGLVPAAHRDPPQRAPPHDPARHPGTTRRAPRQRRLTVTASRAHGTMRPR